MNSCPTCGQTLPPSSLYEMRSRLTPIPRRIFDIVYKVGHHGITTDRLTDLVYYNYPDGGPDSGRKTVQSHICKLNRALKPFGKRIRATRSGGHMNGQGICGIYVYEDLRG